MDVAPSVPVRAPRGQAVVIGAGIAGLLAARVLTDAYKRVVVLEQDTLPDTPRQRPGVPQGHHVHGLTAHGAALIEGLFPGLRQELAEAGAPLGDFGERTVFLFPQGWSPRTTTGIPLQTFSRPLLETCLRRRVAALRGVHLRTAIRVTGLTGGTGRVSGVRARQRGDNGGGFTLDADLVVDAGGRTSHLPDWLEQLGLPRPQRAVIDADLAYSSRLYSAPRSDAPPWDAAMETLQPPGNSRGFFAARIEGSRLLITLQGAAGNHPPHDPDAFSDFARRLHSPLGELLGGLTPQSAVRTYAHCSNRRNFYHRLSGWPAALIAIGDTVCAFNPLYGQGMSVAAMEAALLRTMLTTHPDPASGRFAASYQRRVARLTRLPWLMSTLPDRGWIPDERRQLPVGTAQVALTLLQRASVNDPEFFRRFLTVMHMLKGPSALLHPRALRTLLASVRHSPAPRPNGAERLWWGREVR
ncbi:NAD(P)/FAD-dependent oxidoreductase [Streptomyces sirii]|uniref:NAD(P)/FAD-dependent oxidoreductase n=1 Tax=Streptomyces sirii TaxID=3127701 RepID=UPI003D361795